MATTEVKELKVTKLSKFGFFAEGFEKGLYFSKKFTDQVKVVPGVALKAEVYVSDAGSMYLNKILSATTAAKVLAKEVVETAEAPKTLPDAERAKRFTPKFQKKDSETMSKAEWADKDQRISRQGVVQAAVQALAPVVSLEKLPAETEKLANWMLEFVNRK